MSWRPAPSLTAILHDADRVAPGRSHASDGTIGDAAHAATQSDHNPDARGVVHACDVTNDPAAGFDAWHWAQVVADRIKSGQERRVKYLVSNAGGADLIFDPPVSMTWRQNGSYKTDHRSHLHVSVLYTAEGEGDISPFFVAASNQPHPAPVPSTPPVPAPAHPLPVLRRGASGQAVKILQALLNGKIHAGLQVDGQFGPATDRAVRQYQANVQRFFHLNAAQFPVDGIVGPGTWFWLSR